MGYRCIEALAVGLIAAAPVVMAAPASAAAPEAVPLFGTWSFAEWFPAMFAQANEAMNALGPIAWLVTGALLAGLAIEELIRVIWVARRGADRGEEDEETD